MEMGDKYICISGHHRIRAANKAGLKKVVCGVIKEVDESTRLRLQLTHNDIVGAPDPELVKLLQQKITEEDLALCGKMIDTITKNDEIDVSLPTFKYVNICMMPESRDEFLQLMDFLKDDDSDKLIIEKEQYAELRSLFTEAFREGFKTPGRAMRRFLDIVKNHEDEIRKEK